MPMSKQKAPEEMNHEELEERYPVQQIETDLDDVENVEEIKEIVDEINFDENTRERG
jgi:hypothetical protein